MVEVQMKGGIARIFLNRPQKVNALSFEVLDRLAAAFAEVSRDKSVHVGVLAGRGRVFSAGADINEMSQTTVEKIHAACKAIRHAPFPVVAAMHGVVIGGALEIAAACDLRVAAKGTRFSMPEVKLGIPSVVEAALLPRLVGAGRAAWLVLTGEPIDARKALAWGLIDQIGSETGLVKSLLAADRDALRAQKQLLQLWGDAPLEESVTRSIERFGEVIARRRPFAGS
jgi:enoyl-CoA hydratase